MENATNFGHVPQSVSNRRQIEHKLVLRQEPNRSRMCGIGEKADRRPVDPPPIIQLHVSDPTAANTRFYLHNPYYFMYATLMDEGGERELNTLSDKKARTMTGSVVASLAHLKDIDGNDGAFFVFPDLSVRCEGVYRLKFSLFEIVGNQIFFCKSVMSTIFTVYSAKKFPGMEESTRLTKLFAEQGLKIRVRKEQKAARPKGVRSRPIATALHADNTPSGHRIHVPTWNADRHPATASAGLAYANPAHRHSDNFQAYSASTMSSMSTAMGPSSMAGSCSAPLQRPSPPEPWSAAPKRIPHTSHSAISHSPQPHTQPPALQYASMADTSRYPDTEPSGLQRYRQHQHQFKSRREVSPSAHTLYSSRQSDAGYSHPLPNPLSSPSVDMANSSTFNAHQAQPQSARSPRAPSQSSYSHGAAHMLPPISAQGTGGHLLRAPDHHRTANMAEAPPVLASRDSFEASSRRAQQAYRQAPAAEDDSRHQQHHAYAQPRPWSPHRRQQHQHYSPTHPGHSLGSEPRYSPYNRQPDAPPTKDSRQHLSPGPSARTGTHAPPTASDAGASTYSDQPSFRVQQQGFHVRTQQPDSQQYYHLAPSRRSAQHTSGSFMAVDAPAPTQDRLHAQRQPAPASHTQQLFAVHTLRPDAAGLPPPPPSFQPIATSLYYKHDEPPATVANDASASSASALPSQQRRIAVHSLLISDSSSSSPEKASGPS